MKRFFASLALLAALLLPVVASAQFFGTSTGTSTATTTPPIPAPHCMISTNTSIVDLGGTVNLSWDSQYADSGTITDLGSVPPRGTQGVIPTPPVTTYFGTFWGPGGTTTCSVIIGVNTGSGSGGGFGGGGLGTWTGGYEANGTYDGTGPYNSTGVYVGTNPYTGGGTSGGGSGSGSSGSSIPTQAIGALVPCSGADDCQFCSLAKLSQNIINFLVGLSIPLAAGLLAWAGLLYFSSSVSPGNIERAKKILMMAALGFFITISAWLVVQTLLKIILNQGVQQYRDWNTVQCVSNRQVRTDINALLNSIPALSSYPAPAGNLSSGYGPGNSSPYGDGSGSGTGISCDSSGSCYDRGGNILNGPGSDLTCDAALGCFNKDGTAYVPPGGYSVADAAQKYYRTDTSGGPDNGNLACAWAVNQILQADGYATIDGNSVAAMEQAIQNGRGAGESQWEAQPGDLIFYGGYSHVGICMNVGCTETLSNSSSHSTFTNTMGPTPGSRFYHINQY
jgi:hypothetical protein